MKDASCIQFTLLKKNGQEDKKHVDIPTTPQSYLKNIPQTNIFIDFLYDSAKFESEAFDEISVPFTQSYIDQPKKYGDETKKCIYLVYDKHKDEWVISRIIVDTNHPTMPIPIYDENEDYVPVLE